MANWIDFRILEIWSSCVVAIFTIVLAYYAYKSHQLNKQIVEQNRILKQRDEEFRQQTSDLYQAMVIATLISGPSGYQMDGYKVLAEFRKHYKGETKIFDNDSKK